MSVVEGQMIARDDQSDNNHILISTQVNANETTNTVKTTPFIYTPTSTSTTSNCKTKAVNCVDYHNVDENSEIHENSYYTFSETKQTFGLNRALKIIFSTPGLVLLVIGYTVMGALIFPLLEVPQNTRQSMEIAKSREDCLRELWAITEKLNVLYERNWTILVHEQLRQFEGSIVSATRKVAMDNNFMTNTRGALIRANMNTEQMGWTFNEALLYSLTVITTIGHGSLTPKTPAGKIATILYALIGVPLMLMCLSSLGILLADALQCTYAKLCCQLTRQHSNVSSPDDTNESSIKLQEGKYERHCSLNDQQAVTTACQNSANKSIANAGCNGCKYDGILSTVNSHNDNKFCDHGISEDASHSKQNAMQYKLYCNSTTNNSVVTAETAAETVAQTKHANVQYQQQQQQQQSKPMKADIMLMPVTTNVEKPITTTTATNMRTYTFSNVGESILNSTPNSLPQPSLPLYFQHPVQTIRIEVSQANPVNGNNTSTMPRFLAMPNSMMRLEQQQPHLVATTNNCRFMLPVPITTIITTTTTTTISHSPYSYNSKWANVTTQPTKIYIPITATSTLPRQSSYTQTFNRYEHIIPPQSKAIDYQLPELPDIPYPIATSSPIGMRRAKVLTNPLSPELTNLRKTCVINKNSNAIDSIHNNKYSHEMTTLPAQHTVDCRATVIMEDEEENEQRRLGNCPHGTPSRVPLIEGQRENIASKRATNDLRSSIKGKRGLIGVTFHRHSYGNCHNSSSTYLKSQQYEAHNSVKRHRQRRSYCVDGIEASDDDNDDDDYDDEYVHNSGCYVRNRPVGRESAKEEPCINDEDAEQPAIPNSPEIPISIVLMLLTCYLCLGAGIFAFWENWSLIDGAYFCFVTLTTIGYGDFVPENVLSSADIHFFTFCAYLLIGLILVAMALSIFETQLLWKCRRIAVRLKLVN